MADIQQSYEHLWTVGGLVVSPGLMAVNSKVCWEKYKKATHKKYIKRILISIGVFTIYLIAAVVWYMVRTPIVPLPDIRVRALLFSLLIGTLAISFVILNLVVLGRLDILEVSRGRISILQGIMVCLASVTLGILLGTFIFGASVSESTYRIIQLAFFATLFLFVAYSIVCKFVTNYKLVKKISSTYETLQQSMNGARVVNKARQRQLYICILTSLATDLLGLFCFVFTLVKLLPQGFNCVTALSFGIHYTMESIFQTILSKFVDEKQSALKQSSAPAWWATCHVIWIDLVLGHMLLAYYGLPAVSLRTPQLSVPPILVHFFRPNLRFASPRAIKLT